MVPQARADVAAEGLTLALPNGQALLQDARIDLPKGRATLISGVSGSGKSTLFRALAGIWPFGQGHVTIPAGARVLFLPQKPYIPIGTLRDALKYPDEKSTATDAEIVDALKAAQLGHLVPRLDEEAHWSNILSGGEQQRVAVGARAGVQARLAVHGRGDGVARRRGGGRDLQARSSSGCRPRPWSRSAIARPCGNGTTGGSSCSASPARPGGWSR